MVVYPQMNHIECPEGIIIGSAVQVDVDGESRIYSAVPGGTLDSVIDDTTALSEYVGTEKTTYLFCTDGKLYVYQKSARHGWGWCRIDIGKI